MLKKNSKLLNFKKADQWNVTNRELRRSYPVTAISYPWFKQAFIVVNCVTYNSEKKCLIYTLGSIEKKKIGISRPDGVMKYYNQKSNGAPFGQSTFQV